MTKRGRRPSNTDLTLLLPERGATGAIFTLSTFLRPHRDLVLGIVDAVATMVGWVFIRLTLDPHRSTHSWVLPTLVGAQFIGGFAVGLYRNRWSIGSFDETVRFWLVTAVVALGVGGASAMFGQRLDALDAVGALFAGSLIGGLMRAWWRRNWERQLEPGLSAMPVIVVGTGGDGERAVKAMMADPASPYRPVALLDDDPHRAHRVVLGVPVIATSQDLAKLSSETHATHVLMANPSAALSDLRALSEKARAAGLEVLTIPSIKETFGDEVRSSDIRPLREADLLNRREIETDLEAIGGYLRGKRVLVTGAGGSIGSELCRQLHAFGPSTLLKLDRDESGLHATQLSIEGHALLNDPALIVADIRDLERMHEIFQLHRPEIVFHAAALKHLPLLEMHPSEAWKTNVLGTMNVLEAAAASGVECFVNISTDKAANPCSILGYSKRTAERLTASFALQHPGRFISVRFGNVLGSRGSMVETFRAQIAKGEAITVTHPDITRFFMTVEEAVQLLIQAGAVGRTSEVLILDMGEPVRIIDVARRLASLVDPPAEIRFVGMRTNEKLHEELFGPGEIDDRPLHPLISHVVVPPLSEMALRQLGRSSPSDDHRDVLIDLCEIEHSGAQNAP